RAEAFRNSRGGGRVRPRRLGQFRLSFSAEPRWTPRSSGEVRFEPCHTLLLMNSGADGVPDRRHPHERIHSSNASVGTSIKGFLILAVAVTGLLFCGVSGAAHDGTEGKEGVKKLPARYERTRDPKAGLQ